MKIIVHGGVPYVPFIDVSGWQFKYINGNVAPDARPPNYHVAKSAGFGGCIHRIGNGTKIDLSFGLGYAASRAAGFPYGAYYYAQPNTLTGAQSAQRCNTWLGGYPDLELPLMLDFEAYNGVNLSPTAMYRWLREFFDEAERIFGRPALLYAGSAFAKPTTVAGSLADIDTVQPRYSRNYEQPPINLDDWASWIRWDRPPNVNSVLGDWEGWQFSSSAAWRAYGGPIDSTTDRLDVNIVPLADWNRWLPVVAPPVPTPIPPVPGYRYVATEGEDVTYQIRHREPTWPSEAIFNVTASTIIHLQNGDAANVDAYVGMVPTVSNTKVWVDGDEVLGHVPFNRTMLLQLLRDPARRHISLRHNGEVWVNDGNPFASDPAFADNELAVAWATYQY